MGCSGILVTSVLDPINTIQNVKSRWKFQFLSSFILTVYMIITIVNLDKGSDNNSSASVLSPSSSSTIGYMIGGLCVGLGTKFANGCTSGHGVCGLGRFSVRSLASVVTFLLTGIGTATCLASPYTPWSSYTAFLRVANETAMTTVVSTNSLLKSIVLALSTGAAILSITQDGNLIRSSSSSPDSVQSSSSTTSVPDQAHQNKIYGAIVSGALFAIGLGISGMSQTNKVKSFLDINPLLGSVNLSLYDPTLLTVLGAAVPISAIGYIYQKYYSKKSQSTFCGADWSCIPNRTDIDSKLIGGSMLFGIGWGLVGLCPGPALWSVAAGVTPITLYWFPSFLIGSYIAKRMMETSSKTTYSRIPGSS
jgi:uncharacterized protein